MKLVMKGNCLKVAAGMLAAVAICGCGSSEKSVRMITEAMFPPCEFLRGQEIVGVDVEVCKAVAAKLNKPFSVENVSFDAVIPGVVSGKADIAAAGLTITEDRKNSVDFSEPYVKTGIVIIYKKSNPFLTGAACKGKKVGVQGGTTADEYTVKELGQEPERFPSFAEGVAALKSGRCDLVMCDIVPARNCIKGEEDLALSDFVTSEEYALAIRKGQPELLKAINETIAELKASGQLERWIAAYTEETGRLKGK